MVREKIVDIIAGIFRIIGPIGFAAAIMKYAYTHKDTTMGKLAYLVAYLSLMPMIKIVAGFMKGGSPLLIGVTVVAILLAFWKLLSGSGEGRSEGEMG